MRHILRQTRALVAVTLALGASVALGACDRPHLATTPLTVVGVESEYADVLGQLGGRYVHVVAILTNPSADPHSFEPTVATAQQVAAAAIVVQNGAGYDSFIGPIETATAGSGRRIVSAAVVDGVASTVRNPHLWYRTDTMWRVATRVTADLVHFLPGDRAYFLEREHRFDRALLAWQRLVREARPVTRGLAVAVTEPVGDYLLEAMGLRIATPFTFQADVMNGIDPSPELLAYQSHLLQSKAVNLFCFNRQVESVLTQRLSALAHQAHVPTCELYETLPSGEHYQQWMMITTKTIVADLRRTPRSN